MPTDLTGTPTSLGIGTYNVDADAPSGLGFNAAMAQIDALIASRLATPAGILTGEVPVWNGATWARSSVTGMAPSGLSGYPNNQGKVLHGDGSWLGLAPYRKTTTKQVVNSIAETDLLNGEIIIAAGVLGTNGAVRLTAYGDLINNTGASVGTPRLKLKLGATTLIDSGVAAAIWATNAVRWPWEIRATIQNLGAANSQWTSFLLNGALVNAGTSTISPPVTGVGFFETKTGVFDWDGRAANASAVDTTVAQALTLTVTLATANALEDMTLKGALVEIV